MASVGILDRPDVDSAAALVVLHRLPDLSGASRAGGADLREMARNDRKTGLYNAQHFEQRSRPSYRARSGSATPSPSR